MARTDLARRVYNHTWKLDPIVRSLLDTDFYKLLMLQMIWGLYPEVEATFSLINRTTTVRLAEEIDESELRDAARPRPHAALLQEGDDLARRQQLLRPQADLRAGVPGLARQLPAARIRAHASATASTSSRFAGPWMYTTHVGDPGARHHQRTALAHGDEGVSARSRSTCSMPAPRPRCGPRSSG